MKDKQRLNKIKHDIKRIATALKMLQEQIDLLFMDVMNGKEEEEGG